MGIFLFIPIVAWVMLAAMGIFLVITVMVIITGPVIDDTIVRNIDLRGYRNPSYIVKKSDNNSVDVGIFDNDSLKKRIKIKSDKGVSKNLRENQRHRIKLS